jgi:penicillin-binding protein 1A
VRRRRRSSRKSLWKKWLIITLIAFTFFFLFSMLSAFALVASAVKDLPDLEKAAQKVQLAQTTKIFSSDGKLIATLHAEENREIVPLNKISPYLRNAVVAIEDERFYKHRGVDYEAIARALIVDITSGETREGGSTITQQYVKNMFTTRERSLRRKIKEAVLAYQIESMYSKDKILEKYLNTIYFGHGCYGAETASLVFFGKHAKDLSLSESALLAGVIRSPSRYSPYDNPELAKARRNLVLSKMAKLGYITPEEAEKAKKEKIKVKKIVPPKTFAPYFVEFVKQKLIDKYGANRVFRGGLRVYTTLDIKAQLAAEKAISETLDRKGDPSAALVAIEPSTGYIKAMVGGRDFNTQKFNLAAQGKRQPGSAFKVFVLTTGIEEGISPSKTYQSSPVTIKLPGKDWRVRNATEGKGGGPMTIRQATIHSVNAVFARFIMDVGPEKVVQTAKKMGITTKLNPNPAIALGGLSIGVSPLEMASAYATLANGGKYCAPKAILKVTDSTGRIIEETKVKPKPVISSITAYLVTDILKDVIRYGTGRRANIGRPAAGKTGTTQEYRDAWFVGYTPHLSCAVWVGYPQGQIPLRNIHGFYRVAGGTIPAIIWKKFMKEALKDYPKKDFPTPTKGLVKVRICTESGLRATPFCPHTKLGVFPKGKAPWKNCNLHKGVTVPNVVGKSASSAAAILQDRGFNVITVLRHHSTVPKGQVYAQDPIGGKIVRENSQVTIIVSDGPEPPPPSSSSSPSSPSSPPSSETTESEETTQGG